MYWYKVIENIIITQSMCLITLEDITSTMSCKHYKDNNIHNSSNF